MKKLIINRAKCLLCNDVITSEHSHDFKTCKCGNLSIDGGNEYPRRLYNEPNSYQDLSEYDKNLMTDSINVNIKKRLNSVVFQSLFCVEQP